MSIQEIEQLAKRLRYWSLRMSTQAGSGHPTSSLSAADITAVLLAKYFCYDVKHPENLHNDRLIFSKGHASPLYYALWEALGVLDAADLMGYRQIESTLEGHPTPRFAHTLVSTGSLGMGLGFSVGIAEGLRRHGSNARTWVLLGDGEMAEGAVWESLAYASKHNLANLTAIIDGNRLGQTGPTAYEHHLEIYAERIAAFGWEVLQIDGHNLTEINQALSHAREAKNPVAIVAKTIKGRGVSFLEDVPSWHGKALSTQDFDRAVLELGDVGSTKPIIIAKPHALLMPSAPADLAIPQVPSSQISVRRAVGQALAQIAQADSSVVVIDGDVGNSTFTELVKEHTPDQFIQSYIAEQLMVSLGVGLSSVHLRPVVATFAAFFTRAYDHIRMAAVSQSHITLIGTHVGVSIGQDGPSQMGLEDMAMMRAVHGSVVLSPSDGVSAAALTAAICNFRGIGYLRATRADVPLLYKEDDQFKIGGSSVLQSSPKDQVTIVATGICVHQALQAYMELKKIGIVARVIDAYSVKPIDVETLHQAASATPYLITIEDHWPEGGLGDAVLNAFAEFTGLKPHVTKLAVYEMPRSGQPEDLLKKYRIDTAAIVTAVKSALKK